ncbi:Calcium-transporting ATPase 2 [Scedosporium apiospermum]|uniref:Calcium-transporting ATPase n=1 Tax=Pseudallescheria apiosperma TaxID=563466 RepID=A0A084G3J2_PSEDA|nr:Calcium-transporting ATPase 2 [Scedosporium apiospermum]KEZ41904.1 Calcium-transporting ATPase 2 [Scedosporium apiospermum]
MTSPSADPSRKPLDQTRADTSSIEKIPFSEAPSTAKENEKAKEEPRLDISDDEENGSRNIPCNPFAFTPVKLHKLSLARSIDSLNALGGLPGLAAGLRTDLEAGLSADEDVLDGRVTIDEAIAASKEGRPPKTEPLSRESSHPHTNLFNLSSSHPSGFADRIRIFGRNILPRRKQKSFLRLAWIAFNDKLIMLLSVSAIISLALGIYESVSSDEAGSNIEWVDGATVVVAILVIVFASAATDWQKNHKFEKLNERKEQRDVTVVRSGKPQRISIHDVLVGDLMRLEAGDIVAVDGVLVHAAGIQINESSISGESELVHKHAVSEDNPSADPFILSGTTVSGGYGTYLVTSVGTSSTYGRILMSLRDDVEETPLQQRLGRLAKQLITLGAIAGAIFFLIIFIRFLVNLRHSTKKSAERGMEFLELVILAVTVVVITVPEGLALAVTIALAFATSRMLRDNNLVRLIRSCEIMGNATCICSDKTGTLTQNDMSVVVGMIGPDGKFSELPNTEKDLSPPKAPGSAASVSGITMAQASLPGSKALTNSLSPAVKELVKDSVALNSTAFESDGVAASEVFIGSSTETALLKFARNHLGMGPLNEERTSSVVVEMVPFDSSRKWMAAVVKLADGRHRLFVKGAAEMVLRMATTIISSPKEGLQAQELTQDLESRVLETVHGYAMDMLRPITIAYKDLDANDKTLDNLDSDELDKFVQDLTFIGIFGIQDPLRPEVVKSVRQCQEAGVFVRMVTGDSFLTAKSIASKCGIYTAGGIAMDGPTFRRLSPSQLDAIIPRLQVLARASPEDKLTLVSHLKGMGETVAVTGDGTNDALALKAADVGFAMGIQGTETAKEAASIILLDDNFASIVKALSWGRTVNAAVKKFLQFQFTINITAGTLTVLSTLVGDTVFTIVQLLWINLIMDIFASLGLATDYPSYDFFKLKPEPRKAPIVTITMWKMVIAQAIYQLAVIFTLHYAGPSLFNPSTPEEVESLQTLVFNVYVFMQLFNQHNCRRVDNRINIYYQGVLRNPWFLGVQCLTIAGQMIIVFKGGEAFDTKPLSGAQWGWTILFGILTIPLGMLVRQVPDEWVYAISQVLKRIVATLFSPFSKLVPARWRKKKEDEELGIESWVLRTGSALLRPVNYRWGGADEDDFQHPRILGGTAVTIPSVARKTRTGGPELTSGGAKKAPVDLRASVMASRASKGPVEAGLEEHPDTKMEEVQLFAEGARDATKGPPSQDPRVLKLLNLSM